MYPYDERAAMLELCRGLSKKEGLVLDSAVGVGGMHVLATCMRSLRNCWDWVEGGGMGVAQELQRRQGRVQLSMQAAQGFREWVAGRRVSMQGVARQRVHTTTTRCNLPFVQTCEDPTCEK